MAKKLTKTQKKALLRTGSLGKALTAKSKRKRHTRKGIGSVARPSRAMLAKASKLRKKK